MSCSKAVLASSNKIIKERNALAISTNQNRRAELYQKVPEIRELCNALSATGLSVAKSLSMGENAEKYIEELSQLNLRIQKEIKVLLKANGYSENYLEIPFRCKKCSDTGFVSGHFCTCRKELIKELSHAELNSVSPASNCNFNNFELNYYPDEYSDTIGCSPRGKLSEILEFCKEYSNDFDPQSPSLYLYGATGLGKTHLTLAIANTVIDRGYYVKYSSAQNMFTEIEKEKFSSNSTDYLDELMSSDLLIIDDLGSEFSTQFTQSALYNIINTRINQSKPIIISTNLNFENAEQKYTQRTASRIFGNFTMLPFYGNDIRQIKHYNN